MKKIWDGFIGAIGSAYRILRNSFSALSSFSKTAIIAGFAALCLGIFVMAGPWITLYQIKTAINEGNTEALTEHFDMPKIRDSLRRQMTIALDINVLDEMEEDPFAALGFAFVSLFVNRVIDTYVSDAGLALLMQSRIPEVEDADNEASVESQNDASSGDTDGANETSAADAMTEEMNFAKMDFEYVSLSKFVMRPQQQNAENEAEKPTVEFALERRGVRWVVADIKLDLDNVAPESLVGGSDEDSESAEAQNAAPESLTRSSDDDSKSAQPQDKKTAWLHHKRSDDFDGTTTYTSALLMKGGSLLIRYPESVRNTNQYAIMFVPENVKFVPGGLCGDKGSYRNRTGYDGSIRVRLDKKPVKTFNGSLSDGNDIVFLEPAAQTKKVFLNELDRAKKVTIRFKDKCYKSGQSRLKGKAVNIRNSWKKPPNKPFDD